MNMPKRLTDLSQDAVVELFTLDTSTTHQLSGEAIEKGQILNWVSGTIGDETVKFGGVEYIPLAISATDYEWNGQGSPPQPKLQIQNIGGIVAGLTMSLDDLVGATVTRTRTFKKHLDGQSEANANTFFEPDIFTINRKSLHNKSSIEFELATPLEVLNKKIPSTVIMRNTCSYHYRQFLNSKWYYGDCPYAGSAYYDQSDVEQSDPAKDICSRRFSGCLKRYGQKVPLPIKCFAGAGLSSSKS